MMPFEYSMLALMTLFFIFAWLPTSIGKVRTYGWKWAASNRGGASTKELPAWVGRVERAYNNLKDFYPAFAVVIVLLGTTGRFDEGTSIAAALYVFMRLAHFICYGVGNVTGRALCWLTSVAANIYLLIKLF